MTLKVFNRTTLLSFAILLFSYNIYIEAISPFGTFSITTLDFKLFSSFILMYFLGNFLLPKKIREYNIPSNLTFMLLMVIFIYSIYLVSDIKFYSEALFMSRNFSMNLFNSSPYFHPSTILFAWIMILISSLSLKKTTTFSTKKHELVPENMMLSYFILFFGLLYILGTNVSSFFESAKIVLMQEPSIIDTGYEMKWFVHIKRLLINIILLSIYSGFIFYIEKKYVIKFNKQVVYFISITLLVIGLYSFKLFITHVNFLIFSEMVGRDWKVIYLLFIPILLGFYFLSIYSNKSITKHRSE